MRALLAGINPTGATNSRELNKSNRIPSTVFPLEDLPLELRNEIYKHSLVINGYVNVFLELDHEAMKADFQEQTERVGLKGTIRVKQQYITRFRPMIDHMDEKPGLNFKDLCSPTILRVSRNTYNEALPILYQLNKFRFTKPIALQRFAALIGAKMGLLTDVEVESFPLDAEEYHVAIKEPLRHATKLHRLALTLSSPISRPYHLQDVANQLVCLINAPRLEQEHSGTCAYSMTSVCTCISSNEQKRRINMLDLQPCARSSFTFDDKETIRTEFSSDIQGWIRDELLRVWNDKIRFASGYVESRREPVSRMFLYSEFWSWRS